MKPSYKSKVTVCLIALFLIIVVLELVLRITGLGAFPNEIHDQTWINERYTPVLNSMGFRDKEYHPERLNDTQRIIVIGDSFTYGYGVLMKEAYPKQLEASLNIENQEEKIGYEVLNFGYPGWNIDNEFDIFVTKAIAYHPDIIFIGFTLNDLDLPQTEEERVVDILFNPVPYFNYPKITSYSRILRLAILPRYNRYKINEFIEGIKKHFDRSSDEWKQYTSKMIRMNEIAKQEEIEFIVILFPMPFEGYPLKDYSEQVKIFLIENNIKVIDLSPIYYENEILDLVLSETDPHPSVNAHTLVSNVIKEYLTIN